MLLGELLVQEGLVDADGIGEALERQRQKGGTLGDNLIALGKLSQADLQAVFRRRPTAPSTLAELDIDEKLLLSLMLKVIYVYGHQTATRIGAEMRLRTGIVNELLQLAKQRGFLEIVVGETQAAASELRYNLTGAGKERTLEALELSHYAGPAPVSLAAYVHQLARQRITHERVDHTRLGEALSDLVLPAALVDDLGPAVNSGRVVLLYGPSGNGKTAIATALARAFLSPVYVPHALLVEGQIVQVFDPAVHEPADDTAVEAARDGGSLLRRDLIDDRWVKCYRPRVVTGGELTLAMLDLAYNKDFKHYEAPLQVRAAGGVLVIDDFGHQAARPADLLNRWRVPLERGIDHLTLATGTKHAVPLDLLVIFATNLPPTEILDPAIIRRIPFKIPVSPPTVDRYTEIFRIACRRQGLDFPDDLVSMLMDEHYRPGERPLAGHHPDFIVDYVVSRARFDGVVPKLTPPRVMDALSHLNIREYVEG